MFRKQKDSVKVADLIIFCNEKDSQQYLVFDLKYGDNIIGKNSSLCSIVLSFTKEIDDVHTKISIEDDDYTIEDLGSQKGTFKIKSDNSLIRLKPNKSYDLSNNHIFYIGKYKCKFQIVKPGRAMAFSLSPTDILNSQKNNNNTSVHQNANINNRKGSKKVQSYEDDIEDSTDLPSKQQHKKNQITSKMIQNRLEAENIDEEEDEKHFQKINNNKTALASSVAQSKKATNTQKNFVKSKGQLAKGIKGTFKNGQSDEDQDLKKEDIYDITNTQLYKVSDEEEEDCEFQFSFPKSFKKNNNQDEEQPTRKRAASNRKNNGVQAQQQKHDEDEMKLDSQFLKRIQDKLKSNTEINEQRKVINDLAQKYSSQKNTQKQSQDIPFDDKKEKQASLEKKESEDYWSPSTLKRKNTNKAEATSDKNKSKTLNKEVKNETEASKVEAPSKKIWKEKEQISKQDPTNKKNSKKQEEDQEQEEEQQEPKKKEVTSKSKKDLKLKYKNKDKMEKLKQQAENVLNTIKNSSNQSKKQDHESADKSKTKQKDKTKSKTKSKTFDDSTSIGNNDNDEDEEYSIEEEEEEDMQSQSQKIAKAISTRKRKYDDLMTQQTKQETNKNSKSKEQISKQIVNDKEKTKTTDTNKTETDSKGKNSDAKKKHSKETPQAKNSKETKASEEQKKSKPQNNKQQKNELQDKQVDKIKEEKPASLRRSTRKNQIEEEEKEEKITKKSVTKTVQKASAKKSTSKKQSKKENSDEGEEEEENQMEIEEPKSTRKSARKSILKAQSVDNSQQNEDQISKDQSKKSRRSEKNTVKSKKETQKPKSLIRRTLGSKKEALLLQQSAGIIMDIPRRNKFRIIFSNSSITDEEKKQMSTYGVKILNEFHSANDFNILVTDEFKRRLKTLVALNKGYPIISQNWIKECIKEDKIVPYESFVITKVDKALAKQHNFELKKSINNQKDHPEGILHGLTFVCQNSFDNLNKEEVRKLVESAGGSFLYEKPKNTSAYFLSDPSKSEYNKQQNESNEIVLDIEGLLQTCLLQFNVLGNYIITSSAKEKKSTKKK
ncbi:hypothetical protein ABPG72_012443 [Tetrahymena utriculariae]